MDDNLKDKNSSEKAGDQENKEEKNQDFKSDDVKYNKFVAALSYIGILFLIPLFIKKDSPFCQFHAKQGLTIFIMEIIAPFLVPFFGLGVILWLLSIIFSIWGILNALNGKEEKLPIIGDMAEKFNL